MMTNKPASQIPRTILQGWTFLIVDDQPDNLAIAKAALEYRGATVHTATDGEQGLTALLALTPTVILLDLSMPKLDGWTMLNRLRERPETIKTPVIALTAHAMEGDRERVMNAGFNGYIAKPFDVMTLGVQVQEMVGSLVTIDAPEKPAEPQEKL